VGWRRIAAFELEQVHVDRGESRGGVRRPRWQRPWRNSSQGIRVLRDVIPLDEFRSGVRKHQERIRLTHLFGSGSDRCRQTGLTSRCYKSKEINIGFEREGRQGRTRWEKRGTYSSKTTMTWEGSTDRPERPGREPCEDLVGIQSTLMGIWGTWEEEEERPQVIERMVATNDLYIR